MLYLSIEEENVPRKRNAWFLVNPRLCEKVMENYFVSIN